MVAMNDLLQVLPERLLGGWNGAILGTVVLSTIMFLGSIALVWWFIVRMPSDYLSRNRPVERNPGQSPILRLVRKGIKNVIGLAFALCGLIMLLTPGQGLLFIFVGLTLLDFPGKQRLIRNFLARRRVLAAINGIRRRANRPPLRSRNRAEAS